MLQFYHLPKDILGPLGVLFGIICDASNDYGTQRDLILVSTALYALQHLLDALIQSLSNTQHGYGAYTDPQSYKSLMFCYALTYMNS